MKKTALYVAFVAAFVICLCFVNKIVAGLAGDAFEKIDGNMDSISNRAVDGGFFDFYVNDQSIMEKVVFTGWSFFKDHTPGERNKMGIALENSRGEVFLYAVDRELYFERANELAGDIGNYGFNYSISTVSLPSDTYSVSVYCGTDGDNQGTCPLKYKLIKEGRNVSFALESSEVVNFDLSSVDNTARIVIDSNSYDTEKAGPAEIKGWAYVQDHETAGQKVYMVLLYKDGSIVIYDTQRIVRLDVGEAFSNPQYDMSGFHAVIPEEILKSKEFEVIGVIEDENGLHTGTTMLPMLQEALAAGSNDA